MHGQSTEIPRVLLVGLHPNIDSEVVVCCLVMKVVLGLFGCLVVLGGLLVLVLLFSGCVSVLVGFRRVPTSARDEHKALRRKVLGEEQVEPGGQVIGAMRMNLKAVV